MLTQAATLLLSVATRTIFLWHFSIELLGVNTFLTSIVALVSIADLGINTALMYTLYKPLSEHDVETIAAVVSHARRIFFYVALSVLVLGIACLPLIHIFASTKIPSWRLSGYFVVILASSVLSYLMADRQMLLMADQRLDIIKWTTFAANLLKFALQILAIVVLNSFLGFLAAQSLAVVFGNFLAYSFANRRYPFLKSITQQLRPEMRRDIARSVRAMLTYRVGGALLNNTDPIIISMLIGTAALGYYSNYMLVIGSTMAFTELVFAAATAGVGHVIAGGNPQKSFLVFKEIAIIAVLVYSSTSAIILTTCQGFIRIWLGEEFLLHESVLILAVANFLLYGLLTPTMLYRTTTGLFRDTRFLMLITASINLLLSVILGHFFGISGVLAATMIARLCTNFWLEPFLLMRRYLHGRLFEIFLIQGLGGLIVFMATMLVFVVNELVDMDGLLHLIINASLSLIFVTALVLVIWGRSEAGHSIMVRIRALATGSSQVTG